MRAAPFHARPSAVLHTHFMHVLIIEDELNLVENLTAAITETGFVMNHAAVDTGIWR